MSHGEHTEAPKLLMLQASLTEIHIGAQLYLGSVEDN
jgi:hypothetical protein